ncbi:MAG: transketolase [Chloroflexi bacterium]|nr:transketolase [Chloroflexota bacterium]
MVTQTAQPATDTAQWHELAQQLRVDSIRCSTAAGSGHPTSSLSAADLMAVLLAKYLRYDFDHPENPNNDHLIFSKGHASPLLYSMYRAAGAISDQEFSTYRQFGSRLEGHPTPVLPWVDVATGSLGQGFPIGVGVAIAGKCLDKLPYRVWVLLGDSETAEGSVWEAFDKAAHYDLTNLVAIVDVNRLGQTGPTELGWNLDAYKARTQAFGWRAIEIDGHDLQQIDGAFAQAVEARDAPTVILAKTIKGKGVANIENKNGFHGKAIPKDEAEHDIQELGGERNMIVQVHKPEPGQPAPESPTGQVQLPTYKLGDQVPTRKAYGDGLVAVGAARPRVVALDGEVSNSTYSEEFKEKYPERYFEMYIAEQQLVSAAVGLQVRDYVPFASTFAAFFSRAFDFIRMAAISQANIKLCGSHAGVSIGEDGPSQMALEDLAMMRAVHGSTVLYPCDANQTVKLVAEMADHEGIDFLRTTRGKTPVIYSPDESFPIGGSKVVRQSGNDRVAVIAAGITLSEALQAYDQLKGDGIEIRVLDAYSVKPIDVATLQQAARDTGGRLITVEDHWCEGGLGDAVLEALAGTGEPLPRVKRLAVHEMPGSGTPDELLHAAGIDADAIVSAVKEMA